jgi:enterochelin esterase-like enzyme
MLSTVMAGSVLVASSEAPSATAQAVGSISMATAPAGEAGVEIDYSIYLPPGYNDSTELYPSLYLLHGRGDTMAAWQQVKTDLDELISAGTIPPIVVVMPDAPWSERGNYYVDSAYAGGEKPVGTAVETALSTDLISYIDQTYRTVPDRDARGVGGYSMGGYGALRYTLAHQDTFASGMILSPAVYVPLPPEDSSAREFGAFGKGRKLFDKSTYRALNYPSLLPELDSSLPVHLFVAVGDDEWMNPDHDDADHDLDFEAARLYNQVRRSPAVTAELRVLDGGHDFDVWRPAFREGVVDMMSYLRTEPPIRLEGALEGSEGDDRAGGIAPTSEGGTVVGVNAADSLNGLPHAGGLDAVVVKHDTDGAEVWSTALATSSNDRAYGVHAASSGEIYTAGYTRGNLSGDRPDTSSDDAFAAHLSDDGIVEWVTQFGDTAAADRVYGTDAAADGGLYVAGYTSGSIDGTANAGDKDAFVARVSTSGEVEWIRQIGGSGEDKAQAVVEGADGEVYIAGMTSGAMPGSTSHGGLDGWVARLTAAGDLEWLKQIGTTESDLFWDLAADPAGGVIGAGFTGGALDDTSAGGNDALVVSIGGDGATRWLSQDGTLDDDRAAGVTWADDGSLVIIGHTAGRFTVSAGGVDVFALVLNDTGSVIDRLQTGTPFRDGADEWDEANLYVAPGSDSEVWLTGLTQGSTSTEANSGAGDVFWNSLHFTS